MLFLADTYSFINEMAASRFVNITNEYKCITQFHVEKENRNEMLFLQYNCYHNAYLLEDLPLQYDTCIK